MTTDRSVGNTVREMKDTKQRIMESYLETGAFEGFDNVSLSTVASKSGITKATVFSHFESFQALKQAALEFCISSIKADSFSVNFKARDLQDLFTGLINSITDTFTAFPLYAYLSFLEQKKLTDGTAKALDGSLNSMLRARILVALDFTVQRGWLSINDTDACADILTPYFRRGLSTTDESYWDSLMDFLKDLK